MKVPQMGSFQGGSQRNYNNYYGQNPGFQGYQNFQQQKGGNYYQNKNKRPQFQPQQEQPMTEINLIASMKYVEDNYNNFTKININSLGITEKVKAQAYPRFFVIKSFTEEDIHKVSYFLTILVH
jgi:hypothetical protein